MSHRQIFVTVYEILTWIFYLCKNNEFICTRLNSRYWTFLLIQSRDRSYRVHLLLWSKVVTSKMWSRDLIVIGWWLRRPADSPLLVFEETSKSKVKVDNLEECMNQLREVTFTNCHRHGRSLQIVKAAGNRFLTNPLLFLKEVGCFRRS